jgi:hypothetical protein
LTEKQEIYRLNAKAVGKLPTSEDWGKSNGKIKEIRVFVNEEEVRQLAQDEGISFNDALARVVSRQISLTSNK